MARIRADYVFGVLNGGGIDADDTTISSAQLARLPEVVTPDVAALTLHDPTAGEFEIVHVTDHTSGATTATVLRAQEGTAAAIWAAETPWVLGITQEDVTEFTSGGGGGSGGWTATLDLPLDTLTGWTVGSGTWAVASGAVRQSDATVNIRRLLNDTRMPMMNAFAEVDVTVNSATSTASGARAGFVFAAPSTDGTGGLGVFLQTAVSSAGPLTTVHVEQDSVVNWADITLPASVAIGATARLRAHRMGDTVAVWVDGTYVGAALGSFSGAGAGSKFALYTRGADASFDNLRVWTPTLPA